MKLAKIFSSVVLYKKKILPTKYDKAKLLFIEEQKKFYSNFISKGNLCFDVGANMGFKTDIFLNLGAKVIAIEPQESCSIILKNKYKDLILIENKGVGEKNEYKNFYISDNIELSSFKNDWISKFTTDRFKGSEIKKTTLVEIITLDSLIAKYGTPKFIKIDVEGYEEEVLKGLTMPFNNLSFEYVAPERIDTIIKCLNILKSRYINLLCNYAVYNENKLKLNSWLNIEEMILEVMTTHFKHSFAGDIYVCNITH